MPYAEGERPLVALRALRSLVHGFKPSSSLSNAWGYPRFARALAPSTCTATSNLSRGHWRIRMVLVRAPGPGLPVLSVGG